MIAISSATNAALEILRRTAEPEDSVTATGTADGILKAANGISAEPGKATTQAANAISTAMLDKKARADAFVGLAMEMVNSERFKTSDPDVRETLKSLINANGEALAARIEAELEGNPGLRQEEAIANALTATVRSNRSRFTEAEIVLGYDLKYAPDQLHFIADSEGHSSGQFLMQAETETLQVLLRTQSQVLGAKDDTLADALADAILAQKAAERSYQRALQSLQDWNAIWTKKFGWQEGSVQAR